MKRMAMILAAKGFMRGIAVAVISTLILSSTLGGTPLLAGDLHSPRAQTNPGKPPSGVGKIEVEEQQQVVLMVGGIVETVSVDVGDQVDAGDPLVQLDTQNLEWAVQDAEMDLESARLQLAKLNETVDDVDIAQAEAQYLLAQENLAVVEAGPTEEELNAAKSSLAAAQAAYSELQAGPTQAQLTQAQANLRRAEITLQEAQREYDKIAWRPDAGATSQSADLQQATISYEAAKAAYEETTEPARTSELQSALASLQRAQDTVNELEKQPTSAALAAARADLADAEATLAELRKGPNENDLRLAEISVEQALTNLEKARLDLANAEVTAPIAGTVLAVNVEPGEQAGGGTAVVTIADTTQLKLVVNVEQRDIPLIHTGEDATISVYALGNQKFDGVIDLIVPVSDESSGLVTYPVTIRITSEDLDQLLPGMTATATFSESTTGNDAESEADAAAEPATETATATEESTATETETATDAEADAEVTPEATPSN
ncbi:MAG: efflux RND transporter periplasmic adaptor subunit [Caldilineaceae bacterium]|nr:efflux RND transporter periplasmic adaptor subunit [Caldilineaceae bacterium]